MAVSLKHSFQSAKGDGTDATLVQPSNWNAEHTLTMGADSVLGRTNTPGAAAEITCTAFGRSVIACADQNALGTLISSQQFTPSDTSVTFAKLSTTAVATLGEFRSATANKVLTSKTPWDAAEFVPISYASTISLDLNTGINFSITLTGNTVLANPTNAKVGQTGIIYVAQDGTGGRTLSFGSNYKFPNGTAPLPDTTASYVNIYNYFVVSSTFIVLTIIRGVR